MISSASSLKMHASKRQCIRCPADTQRNPSQPTTTPWEAQAQIDCRGKSVTNTARQDPRLRPGSSQTYLVAPAFVVIHKKEQQGWTKLIALVDTGANFSTISRELAPAVFKGKVQNVILHNGSRQAMDQASVVTFQLGSMVREHTCYVSDTLACPVILGLDFLDTHGIDVCPRNRWIVLRDCADEHVSMVSRKTNKLLCVAWGLTPSHPRQDHHGNVVEENYPSPVVGNAPLTVAQRGTAEALLTEFTHCFSSRDTPLGNVTSVQHRVQPRGAPFKARLAALSPAQIRVQQECLDEMIKLGVARPSNSEWASRPSFAPKQDGTIRFCLNFRRLNQFDTKDNYPLPRAPDLLERLSGKRFFSKLDAAMGYWQIPIHPDDIKYTAVITQAGLYEFTRMPFGLSNAPATYQRLMDQTLADGRKEGYCCVYLDDVLIFSDSFEAHCVHLRKCFQKMYNAGLLLKSKKCTFFDSQCEYLGHVVGNGKITMMEKKIRKVINFPEPQNIREVMSFLGVTGYYRKFVKDFAKIANPLNLLTHKGADFVWTPACAAAFETLKRVFNESVPLQMPDYTKPFIIDTDASDIAIGAVLGQIDGEGKERPVFFASRKLSPAEKKWPVRDKEALAIMYGCESFRHHVLGTHFTVRSDHHSLQWLMNASTGRIARWATQLAEYEPFDIVYRRGESNKVADALSRVYAFSECMPDVAFAATALVRNFSNEGKSSEFPNPTHHLSVPTREELFAAQAHDDFCIKTRVRQVNNTEGKRSDKGYLIRDGLLGIDRNGRFLPVLPDIYREKFLQELHAHPMHGHMGARRLSAQASEIFAIPRVRKYARETSEGCDSCLRRKKPAPKVGQLASTPPQKAWELISMDFCGPYITSAQGNKYVLVIIDQFTKYVHLTPCRCADAQTAGRALYSKIICSYGTPDKLLSDNGSHFRNKYMSAICAAFGIFQTFSSPYYPQGDGQVERFMRNMNDSLSALSTGNPISWCEYIPGVQSAYNSTPHAATFVAPYTMLFGKPPPPILRTRYTRPAVAITRDAADEAAALRKPLEEVSKFVRDQVERTWLQRAIAYNRGRSKISIVVGERCLIRLTPAQMSQHPAGKLRTRWSEPCRVIAAKQSGKAFDVLTTAGDTIVVNATRMLPLPPSHWIPKRPTMKSAWDENEYVPEYPGVEFCTASASGTAKAQNGLSVATQTMDLTAFPAGTEEDKALSPGGTEYQSGNPLDESLTTMQLVEEMHRRRRSPASGNASGSSIFPCHGDGLLVPAPDVAPGRDLAANIGGTRPQQDGTPVGGQQGSVGDNAELGVPGDLEIRSSGVGPSDPSSDEIRASPHLDDVSSSGDTDHSGGWSVDRVMISDEDSSTSSLRDPVVNGT